MTTDRRMFLRLVLAAPLALVVPAPTDLSLGMAKLRQWHARWFGPRGVMFKREWFRAPLTLPMAGVGQVTVSTVYGVLQLDDTDWTHKLQRASRELDGINRRMRRHNRRLDRIVRRLKHRR